MSLKVKQGGAFVGGSGGGGLNYRGLWNDQDAYLAGDAVWDENYSYEALLDAYVGISPFEDVPVFGFPVDGRTLLSFPYRDFVTTFECKADVTFDRFEIYYPADVTTLAGTTGFAQPITANNVGTPTWLANGSVVIPAGAKTAGWYEVVLPASITLLAGQSYTFGHKGSAVGTGYASHTTDGVATYSPLIPPTHGYFNTSATSSGTMNSAAGTNLPAFRVDIGVTTPMWKKIGASPVESPRVLRQIIESDPAGGVIKSTEVVAPAWAKTAHIIIIGPGGGGGSGRRGAAGTHRAGGGGGASGGRNEAWVDVSQLTNRKFSMFLRPAGAGGVARTADDGNGSAGTPSSTNEYNWVDLGSYQGKQQRFGCASGVGGNAGSTSNAAAVVPYNVPTGGIVGTGGGGSAAAGGAVALPGYLATASGGGGGGSVSSADALINSGASGQLLPYANNAGPYAISTEGGAGVAGWTSVAASNCGAGGSGGAAGKTVPGGDGGAGGLYGGGGGGGGGSTNGFNSGKGGDGGLGAVIVTWYG